MRFRTVFGRFFFGISMFTGIITMLIFTTHDVQSQEYVCFRCEHQWYFGCAIEYYGYTYCEQWANPPYYYCRAYGFNCYGGGPPE